jgi:hypothetical protein
MKLDFREMGCEDLSSSGLCVIMDLRIRGSKSFICITKELALPCPHMACYIPYSDIKHVANLLHIKLKMRPQ